jgi:hypothetical protein
MVLPTVGNYRQSLAIDGEKLGFADPREIVSNGRVLYRGALELGSGKLTIDATITHIHDVPTSPVLRSGDILTTITPRDANFNPADARIDQDQYQVAIGYSRPTAWGDWQSLVSYAYSDITDTRAFLHPDTSGTADTQNQRRIINDGYFDTHLTHRFGAETKLTVGADLLYGLGRQTGLNGNDGYTVPLDGSLLPPPASAVPVTEIGTVDDRRLFAGQYAQLDWKPAERWDVIGGVRINEAYEHKRSSDLVFPPPEFDSGDVRKTMIRPTETLGVSYKAWQSGRNETVVFADYRNAFKPAAIDFGPDYTPDLLSPETTQSYELGLKGALADGRLTYQAAAFWLDFRNLVVPTLDGSLANAGGERLKGVEAEFRYQASDALAVAASASYHDATFTQYLFSEGDSAVDVAGRQLILSPHVLASAGVLYTPERGLNATVVARYVGPRYLDEENTARVGGYTTLDANLGYRWGRTQVTLEGTNLSDQRPPVTASEFGSQSFYLLTGRMLWVRLGYAWR